MSLMEHLPLRVYHHEEHVADFQQAVEKELLRLQKARDDLYLQLRPSTSTWGMDFYEKDYAIPNSRNKSKEHRLATWRAKRRGRGTTTKALVQSLAESYTQEPVDVNVYPRQYGFEIKVTGSTGMPTYLNDLVDVVQEVKPAHLGMSYRILTNHPSTVHAASVAHTRTPTRHIPLPDMPSPNASPTMYITAAAPTYYRHKAGGVDNYA